MSEVALFNPLQLSDEEFDTIASLHALNYSTRQIALYLELDLIEFEKAIKAPNSKVAFYMEKGRMESKYLVNSKLLLNAQSGNITATQELNKVLDRNNIEDIKRRILFYED